MDKSTSIYAYLIGTKEAILRFMVDYSDFKQYDTYKRAEAQLEIINEILDKYGNDSTEKG